MKREPEPAVRDSGARAYLALLKFARADPDVVGVVLTGSRGAGRPSRFSDFDVQMVVHDRAVSRVRRVIGRPAAGLDLWVRSMASFRSNADNRPQSEGYGPMYAHVQIAIDKTGQLERLARRKSRIPRSQVRGYTAKQLDGYLNQLLRSLKAFRDGQPFAGHLEATRSIPYLLEAIFGSEGRWAPYAKYLEWELQDFPLRRSPLPPRRLLSLVGRVLRSGDVGSQRALFRAIERDLRGRGHGRVFDGWEPAQLSLMRGAGSPRQHCVGPGVATTSWNRAGEAPRTEKNRPPRQ